jgi:general secretion pathway protein N
MSMLPWASAGVVLGAMVALPLAAPAHWLAHAVADASGQRLLLADARGRWWQGDAVLVLSAGADSRDAAALPGRTQWRFGWDRGLVAQVQQSCCTEAPLRLRVVPGFSQWRAELLPAVASGPAATQWLAQWPAAWLVGLGTPWNTLQPAGSLRLASPQGLVGTRVAGQWQLQGSASIDLEGLSSRLSTLDPLGSYRLKIEGGASAEPARLELSTLQGSLRLSGQGQWTATGLRFRGEARAAEGSEAVLNNLLNLIGRRQGPLAVITIG